MTRPAPATSSSYDPARSRALLEAPHTEIENALFFPSKLRDEFLRRATGHGFVFSGNDANSLYLDTLHYDFLRNGFSQRMRRAGVSRVVDLRSGMKRINESFPHQFALKSQHPDFYRAAHEIARRLYPAYASSGLYPNARTEVEGPHKWPADAHELRFSDLPRKKWSESGTDVAAIVASLISRKKMGTVETPDDLVVVPKVVTNVKRTRAVFYVEPGRPVDFFTNWPSPRVTDRMRETGLYLGMEISMDMCVSRMPPPDATINDIVMATGNDFRHFKPLSRRSLIEYEIKAEETGERLSDLQAIDCDVRFGAALLDFAGRMCERPFLRNCAGAVRSTRSKAVTAIGGLPECREDGPYYDLFVSALAFTP